MGMELEGTISRQGYLPAAQVQYTSESNDSVMAGSHGVETIELLGGAVRGNFSP